MSGTTSDWLTVDPSSGNGNATLRHTAAQYNGRNPRSVNKVVTVETTDHVEQATITVAQGARPLYVEFYPVTYDNQPNTGGTVLVKGKTNGKSLTLSVATGASFASVAGTFNHLQSGAAHGSDITNGNDIVYTYQEGGDTVTVTDPGATGEFEFCVAVKLAANGTTSSRTSTIHAVVSDGNSGSAATGVTGNPDATITQNAGASTLSVDKSSITFTWDGKDSSNTSNAYIDVAVTSNTTWVVSIANAS